MDKEVKEFIDQHEYWGDVAEELIDEEAEESIKDTIEFNLWKLDKELSNASDELKSAIYEERYKILTVWSLIMITALLLS